MGVSEPFASVEHGHLIPWAHSAPWPHFSEEEQAAVARVLASGRVNYWTGTEGREFECEFAGAVGTQFAIAMMNGTVTLEACLLALGVGPGDEVVTTPRTFMASASSIVRIGATPVFADVEAASGNISAETVSQVLTPKTKAVIAVHLAGWPCDLRALRTLLDPQGIALIEDCAQAHGAAWDGKPVGSWGIVNSWSFCQDKILTTGGEGGMITTNDEELWSACWSLKDHGKSYEAVYRREHPFGYRWLHESFGTNWRMTEMQAAIGRVILRRLPNWVSRRRAFAQRLNEQLAPLPMLRIELPPPEAYHAYYKWYGYIRPEQLREGWTRDRVVEEIHRRGVPCFTGSCSEIYREQAFIRSGLAPQQSLPVAHELGETSLMLLVHPTLTDNHLDMAIEVVSAVAHEATRA